MGVSLILFHGGVGISLRVLSRVGVGLSGLPSRADDRCGVASTHPAILIPLFDRLNIRPKLSQTLISESGLNDTTGAVLYRITFENDDVLIVARRGT